MTHRLLRIFVPILLLLGCTPVPPARVELQATYSNELSGGGRNVRVVASSGEDTMDLGEARVTQLAAWYPNEEEDSVRFLLWYPSGMRFDSSKVVILVPAYQAPLVSLFPLAIETVRQGLPTLMASLRGFNMNAHLSPGYGLTEIDDVEGLIQAYAALTKQKRVKVGLFGTSIGSVVVANVAAEDSSVRSVVMEGLMEDVDGAARRLFSGSEYADYSNLKRSYLDPARMTPASALKRLRSIPTMLLWGADDDLVPSTDRAKLAALVAGSTPREVPGGGSSLRYGFPLSRDAAIQLNRDIAAFLAASLGR